MMRSVMFVKVFRVPLLTCTEASVCAGSVTCCFSSFFLLNALSPCLLAFLGPGPCPAPCPDLVLDGRVVLLSGLLAWGSESVDSLHVVVLENVMESVMGPVCSGSLPPGLGLETLALFRLSCFYLCA